ncbi:MAG TPA: hypothetical protein VIN59_00780 [Alphaproteobacteria bacterium]
MRTLIFISVFLPFYLLTISVDARPVDAYLTSQALETPLCATSDQPYC